MNVVTSEWIFTEHAWHHLPSPPQLPSAPPNPEPYNHMGGGGMGEMGVEESDETSRIFCGHVNLSEMNGGLGVYGGQS